MILGAYAYESMVFLQQMVQSMGIGDMETASFLHSPYSQVEVDKSRVNEALPPNLDILKGCLTIMSRGIPIVWNVNTGMIFNGDPKSAIGRLNSTCGCWLSHIMACYVGR